MSNFTPGPWMARQKYTGISIYTRDTDGYNGDDGAVANMIMSRDKTPCKVWADARLIAAAPEMYELLVAVAANSTTNYSSKIAALLRRIEGEDDEWEEDEEDARS